ncbi:hypothetical protein [Oscillatoria sp. FACHB-1406]|uniref:hypothetical protein n=1 Tax=Oscillatoria sp. FACHB-1406 TaxID=2692846 RepID=UPI001684AC81|nr:hypothetical protein [Oscillatoria sp. FACHB-1406]MBD2576955.1 hypothetical protein [Oscillatoria sp. FACHB-1406]
MIDNYEQAIALLEKMEARLPIPVRATPELLEHLENQGEKYPKSQEFLIDNVHYIGDMGGIICGIDPGNDRAYSISITHLRFSNECDLAEEIRAYQRKRVRKLAIEQGKLGRAKRLAKRSEKKKGFG